MSHQVQVESRDDGAGGMTNGSVDYATGAIVLDPDYQVTQPCAQYYWEETGRYEEGGEEIIDQRQRLAGYINANCPIIYSTGAVEATYQTADGVNSVEDVVPALALQIDLSPTHGERPIAGSIDFTVGGIRIQDDGLGSLHRTTDQVVVGTINYDTGKAALTTGWTGGAGVGRTVNALATWGAPYVVQDYTFRVPGTLVPGNVVITATTYEGESIVGTAALSGELTGDHVLGRADAETGVIRITFGDRVLDSSLTPDEKLESWYDPALVDGDGYIIRPVQVQADTVRYSAVIYTYVPLDADILGLDPVRLPVDGRVPIVRTGDVAVVHHTDTTELPNPAVAGSTIDLGRQRTARVRLMDATGARVPDDRIDPDASNLDAGVIVLADPLDLTGFTQPITAYHSIEDMVLVTDVQISGEITLNRPVTHDFPLGSLLSTALVWGDTWARYANFFSQATWTGEWSDNQIGSDTTGQYNDVLYPIDVTNVGAIDERWRIEFTSNTEFRVVGEAVGQIAIGDINTDLSPTNPVTGQPYFTLDYRGWGAGWVTGNVVRLNTLGKRWAWIARTVEQGPATEPYDGMRIQIRGDVDRT